MPQISARVPLKLVREVDRAASALNRSRADIIRASLEYYLADLEDLRLGLEALADPADAVLDWEEVRRELLGQD